MIAFTGFGIKNLIELVRMYKETIACMIKTKKLRATKVDRRVLIRVADIEQMLAEDPA